jgi:hypothetical protein
MFVEIQSQFHQFMQAVNHAIAASCKSLGSCSEKVVYTKQTASACRRGLNAHCRPRAPRALHAAVFVSLAEYSALHVPA